MFFILSLSLLDCFIYFNNFDLFFERVINDIFDLVLFDDANKGIAAIIAGAIAGSVFWRYSPFPKDPKDLLRKKAKSQKEKGKPFTKQSFTKAYVDAYTSYFIIRCSGSFIVGMTVTTIVLALTLSK